MHLRITHSTVLDLERGYIKILVVDMFYYGRWVYGAFDEAQMDSNAIARWRLAVRQELGLRRCLIFRSIEDFIKEGKNSMRFFIVKNEWKVGIYR